jgi:hypothetical protein
MRIADKCVYFRKGKIWEEFKGFKGNCIKDESVCYSSECKDCIQLSKEWVAEFEEKYLEESRKERKKWTDKYKEPEYKEKLRQKRLNNNN